MSHSHDPVVLHITFHTDWNEKVKKVNKSKIIAYMYFMYLETKLCNHHIQEP